MEVHSSFRYFACVKLTLFPTFFLLPLFSIADVLVEAEYLSVDPYMRPYMDRFPLGVTMIGGQVGRYACNKIELLIDAPIYPFLIYVLG